MGRRQTFAEALERNVDRSGGPDACWLWMAGRVKGYGQTSSGPTRKYAHHAALELALGRSLADGHIACHTCDNPPCCNPAHLYEGTNRTNADDMIARGRSAHPLGSRRPDMTRKWTRVLRDRGIEAAAVTSDEYAGWMAERSVDASDILARIVARAERFDVLDIEWIA